MVKKTSMSDESWAFYQRSKELAKKAEEKRKALWERLNHQMPEYTWDIFPEEFLWLRPAIEEFTAYAGGDDAKMVEYVENFTDAQAAKLAALSDRLKKDGNWDRLADWCDEYDMTFYQLSGEVSHFLEMLDTFFD